MQISRRILLACVTATALLPLAALPGKDTEAQTKARQALEQNLKELPAQPAAPTRTNAAPAAPQPPPAQGAAVTAWPEAGVMPTNAESKALEDALHQKINELPAQPAAPTRTNAVPAAPQPPPAQSAAVTAWPEIGVMPTSVENKVLEDALHQKMTEMQRQRPAAVPKAKKPKPSPPRPALQPATVPPAAPPVVANPPRPTTEPSQVTPQPSQQMPSPGPARAGWPSADEAKWGKVVIPPGASQDQLDKAQEALQQKTSERGAQTNVTEIRAVKKEPPPVKRTAAKEEKAAPKQAENVKKAPGKAEKKAAVQSQPSAKKEKATAEHAKAKPPEKPKLVTNPKLPPLPTPPPAISTPKEQRLQELLQQYMADKISPEQYHEQRAKILAEP